MPMLHAPRHHEGGAGDDAADAPFVHELARHPVTGAEEGIGRHGQIDAMAARLFLEPAPLIGAHRQRLFGKDVLAGPKRRERDLVMRVGHGQIDHDVDVAAGQERVQRHSLDAEGAALRLGDLWPKVGQGSNRDAAEQRRIHEIAGRDVAAADDADIVHCRCPP